MVSRCANPSCDAHFKYLREGRLFEFRASNFTQLLAAGTGAIEFWWLCPRCCMSMTLVKDRAQGVKLIPLPRPPRSSSLQKLDRTGSS